MPLARFALAGLLTVVVVGTIGVVLQRNAARKDAIRDARTLARLAGDGIVAPNVNQKLIDGDPAQVRKVDALVKNEILSQDGIVRVKLWDENGYIVYSDLHSLRGRRFDLPEDEACVLVFGGSLGARRLNEAAIEAFARGAPFTVLHASGRRDYDDLEERLRAAGSPDHYRLVAYVEPFADALAAADLAVARAGGSVFELAATGGPAVLIPYPYATAGHQEGNARFMADGGAAVVLRDDELDAGRLSGEVGALLAAPERLREMSAAARRLARPEAAKRIAEEVLAAL
jgi:UDP-N-acetylglucosamine:LPS N-acetylglucosamine transferase